MQKNRNNNNAKNRNIKNAKYRNINNSKNYYHNLTTETHIFYKQIYFK